MVEREILVMDDEEQIRSIVRRMLEHLGYKVSLASTGEEAVTKMREKKESGQAFSAVIMDLAVPGGMGGAEAVREIRSIDPSVKAVLSSGYGDDPAIRNYRDHGFHGVIPKPFRLEELGKTLERIIDSKTG